MTDIFITWYVLYHTCQPSHFWLDSPAFLPDVPRPALEIMHMSRYFRTPKQKNALNLCTTSKCSARVAPKWMPLNDIYEIRFDFPRCNFSVLPTVQLFGGQSCFFFRVCPSKIFSRLAVLLNFSSQCYLASRYNQAPYDVIESIHEIHHLMVLTHIEVRVLM